MSERLALALIGCGEIAVHTSKCILESQSARVVHCMDVREELALDLAAGHEARSTSRLEDVLDDEEVRAVVISTPHHLHAPLSVRCAEAGKHVLVEKPIACTLPEADDMIAAADRAGVRLAVMHPQRLDFPFAKARELVRAGALGDVLAVKIHAMSDKPEHYWHGGYTGRVKDDWRIALDTSGGGFLIMNLIHNLDSMVSVLDPAPERIYAEYATLRTPVEVEDFLSFVMRLAGGALVSLDGASAAVGGESFGDRIYGRKGQIAVDKGLRVFLAEPWEQIEAGRWVEVPAPLFEPEPEAQPQSRRQDHPNSRTRCVDGFARAVLGDGGGPEPVWGREGRRALEIARGAYLSMQRGGPVTFPVQDS